jgi:hypothetical protein
VRIMHANCGVSVCRHALSAQWGYGVSATDASAV